MSEEKAKIEAKWAAETYEFLRLFARTKDTVYGLLLVEILWIVTIILAGKAAPDVVPAASGTFSGVSKINVYAMLLPGLAVLFLLWAIWSRWLLYPWFALRSLARVTLKPVLFLFFLPLSAVILLLDLPYAWFVWRRWIKEMPVAKRLSYARKYKTTKPRRLFSFPVRKLYLEFDGYRTEHDYFRLAPWLVEQLVSITVSLVSHARVALAPFPTNTYAEDLNAAKIPPQLFFAAIGRMRLQLKQMKHLQYVRFVLLPVHWTPKDYVTARWFRLAFGFDVVLWGSYVGEDAKTILINIECREITSWDAGQQSRTNLPQVFPYSFEPRWRSVLVDQSDPWNLYILSVLTFIETVRVKVGPEKKHSDKGPQWIKSLIDDLTELWQSLNVHRHLQYLLEDASSNLVFDAFQALPEADSGISGRSVAPWSGPRQLLVSLAGDWVGAQFRETGLSSVSQIEPFTNRLLPVVRKCIQYAPDQPENYYRLGALELLRRHTEEAIVAFQLAAWYEVTLEVADTISFYLEAAANQALRDWERASGISNVGFARYVALVARSVNIGGEKAKDRIRSTSQDKDQHLSFYRCRNDSDLGPVQRAIVNGYERLLDRKYKPARNKYDIEGLARLLAEKPRVVRELFAGDLEPDFIRNVRARLGALASRAPEARGQDQT
jgi:hypothetical protein